MRYETWTGWGRLAVIGLLALVMAACGGNGGTTPMTGGDETPPPVDTDALNAAKAAAMAAYDMAKKAVADVEAHKDADMDSYTTAVTKRDEAKAANDKAQEAETVADAEKYRDDAQTANTAAMKYANMVTDAANKAADAADAAAAVAAAEKIAPVIARPGADDAFDHMIDRNSPNAPTTDADFNTRPLMVDGSKASHTDTKKFTMSSDAPPMVGMDFAGSVHTRADRDAATATRSRVTDEVTVYTNQENAKPTPFVLNEGEGVGVYALDAGGAGTIANPHTALDIDAIGLTSASAVTGGKNGQTLGTLVNIASQHRPPDGPSMITFGKAESNIVKSLSGTFDMAPGTYECTTTCTVTIDKDGKLAGDTPFTSGASDLTFVPASGAMVPQPDTDYLTFGYWVRTSTPMTGDATTMIAPFAAGKDLYESTELTAYEGTIASNTTVSATYTGPATGMFVHKTDVDGDGKGLVPTSSGQFTAEANLTANFSNSYDDPNLGSAFQDAIHGKVSNFVNSSTGQSIEGWELTLNPAKFDGSNANFSVTDRGGFTFGSMTSGGKDTPAGGWRGSFFGPATGPDGDDADENPDPIQPGSVAGEFLGHFENGHAVGAFGATKTKE